MNDKESLEIVDALVNDGYIVIEDAFSSALSQELLLCAQQSKQFKQGGISSAGDLHLDATKRRDKIAWLDKDAGAQSEYLAFAQTLQNILNRELYLGLSYYEAHFAIYEKGDFYEKHLDAFKGSKNRVVTTVYYLNDGWRKEDGGELLIYDKQNSLIQKVLPKRGRLVVFMSEDFPHEVLPTNKKRHSIAGWFRCDK